MVGRISAHGRTDGWRPPLSVKGAVMGIWQRKGGYRLSGSGCYCYRDHATPLALFMSILKVKTLQLLYSSPPGQTLLLLLSANHPYHWEWDTKLYFVDSSKGYRVYHLKMKNFDNFPWKWTLYFLWNWLDGYKNQYPWIQIQLPITIF